MKQIQKSSKTLAGAVFLRMRVAKNQSKIVLKTTLFRDAKTTTQKCQKNGPTWLQIWSKLGPCWVPKSSWTCPWVKKCIPEAIRKEDQKKYRKTSVWGGSRTGSAGRVGAPLGVDFEAKWGSCWGHVGSKIDFRRSWMAFKIDNEV